ncbi:MAG: Cytochrome c oxidase polypeptide, partial [Candidatus Saccharibacteria bacterium]|nr:Cytochrome c oxidase polypeptide [Candidatus Saccharibacteria bacterium]
AISTTRKEFDLWVKAIAGSNSHLDWTTYAELAKPSKNQPVVYYMLHEPDLYAMIQNKYMDGHETEAGSSMMMDHEGMH